MARVRIKHVTADIDRYGNVRYYFRKRGLAKKTRLPGLPGSAEFMAAYQAALGGKPLPDQRAPDVKIEKSEKGSLRWLCRQYMASPEFNNELGKGTKNRRRQHFDSFCNERLSKDNPQKIGSLPFDTIPTKAIRKIRDRRAETPHGANDLLKSLKVMFKWAVAAEHLDHDPAKDVPRIKANSDGFHTWTIEEVRQFEATHPIGTTPRLALALLLYTGQRRSDVVLFGHQHIKNGVLSFTQYKNRERKPVTLILPIVQPLREIIDATPSGDLTLLISQQGKPFTKEGFGNRMRQWCDRAGLPHCSAHGLRKAGATMAAERGATEKQLMAIFGWETLQQVQLYTKRAEQRRLAEGAMHYLDFRENESGANVSHSDLALKISGTQSTKNAVKTVL